MCQKEIKEKDTVCKVNKDRLEEVKEKLAQQEELVMWLKRKIVTLQQNLRHERENKKCAQRDKSRYKCELLKHKDCVIPEKVSHLKRTIKEKNVKISNLEVELDERKEETERTLRLSLKDEHGYTIQTRMCVNELSALEVALVRENSCSNKNSGSTTL